MGRQAGRGCEECLYAAGLASGPSPASGPDWSGDRRKRTVVPTSPHPGLDKATRSLNSGRADAPPLMGTHRALTSLTLSPPLPAGPQFGNPALHPTWPAAFREGMEVIHSGNCECPFPGRGCAWEVPAASLRRPRPPSRPGRTARPDPGGPGTPSGGGRGKCDALARVSPPPAVAPEVPRLPAPTPPPAELFVTARLPVCGLPTPAHFPGREAAEGRECLGGSAPARLLLLQPRIPPPAWEPAPGRCRGKPA